MAWYRTRSKVNPIHQSIYVTLSCHTAHSPAVYVNIRKIYKDPHQLAMVLYMPISQKFEDIVINTFARLFHFRKLGRLYNILCPSVLQSVRPPVRVADAVTAKPMNRFTPSEVLRIHRRPEMSKGNVISMSLCKTAVTPLLTHWSYCSLAPRHRFVRLALQGIPVRHTNPCVPCSPITSEQIRSIPSSVGLPWP